MSQKRRWEKIPGYAGIERLIVLDQTTKLWKEPKRPRYSVRAYKPESSGKPKRFRKVFGTFEEAKRCRSEFAPERLDAHPLPKVSDGKTFQQIKDDWVNNWLPHKGVSTQIRYKSYLKHFKFFDPYRMDKIIPSTIDQWLAHIKSPEYLSNSNCTRCDYEHEFSVLRNIFNFYITRYDRNYHLPFVRDHRQMLKVKEKIKISKDLTVTEFGNFVQALRELYGNSGDEVFYYLALMQYAIYGRIQDAAALSCESFNFKSGKIVISQKAVWPRGGGHEDFIEDGLKRGSQKVIPMSAMAARVYREWTMKSGLREGLLFTYEGKMLTYRGIQHRYDRALKRAGLPFTATHIIRHAALTEFYDTCQDILTTALMAGHSDLKSTQKYTKARDQKARLAQEKMDQKLAVLFEK